jgi:hypothetical protein
MFLEKPEARSGVLGLMDENSTTRSNPALSPGLNPLERLAYYLVRLGTYSAKWAARAAKGEVGKQLSLGGAVAMETAKNFVGGSVGANNGRRIVA